MSPSSRTGASTGAGSSRPRRGPDASRALPLAAFAVAMARHDERAARRALGAARRAGCTRTAAEETALMLVLYAGYPAALEAMVLLESAWPGRARPAAEGGVSAWRGRGVRLCRRVYGPVYPRLVARVRTLHPDLATWMVEQGYGRVLSRRGMAPRVRELVTVAVLAAGGWERQLVSHVMGALRLGAGVRDVRSAVQRGLRGAPPEVRAIARRALRFGLENGARGG